jgi:hypothetical protein
MPWNYCTNRFASPDLAKNPLLNSAGGCYTAPDGGPTMYLSAYDIANSRRSNINPSVGSTSGAAMVHRATMGALFNAPMVGPDVSRRSFGTLGDIASDMCSAGTQRDVRTATSAINFAVQTADQAIRAACTSPTPGDNTCRDLQQAFTTGRSIYDGAQGAYRNLCSATGGTPAAPAASTASLYAQPSVGAGAGAAAPRPPMSTGAKVGIGVGVGLAAMAAFSFFR